MPTVAEKINIGKTSSYLMAEEFDSGIPRGGIINEKQKILLRMAVDIVETQYAADPTDDTLEKTSNYVLKLSKFKDKAMADISAGGGGSVAAPVTATFPSRLDFTVSATSYFASASTGGSISNFIGYNLVFVRGGISQSTIITELSYFTWSRTTGLFTCSPALAEGEIIALIPV